MTKNEILSALAERQTNIVELRESILDRAVPSLRISVDPETWTTFFSPLEVTERVLRALDESSEVEAP